MLALATCWKEQVELDARSGRGTLGDRCRRSGTAQLRRGLIDQVPASTAKAAPPGISASHGLTSATAPAPDQVIEENASAKVAMREDTCRRRNRLRLTWARNQNWISVAEVAAVAMPKKATSAGTGSTNASKATAGAKTTASTPA